MSVHARRWTTPALATALIALTAVAVIRRAPRSTPAGAELLELHVELDEFGAEVARVDPQVLGSTFAAWKLPAPPDLDRIDAIPVRIALESARQWARTRDGDALGRLGGVYLAFEHYAHAAECFAAAAELGRDRERWLFLLGACCQSLKWNGAALEALERARELAPRQAVTHARLGELYLEAGRPRDALASFTEALKLQPSLSVAAAGRARVQLERGELSDALSSAQDAVRSQPGDFAAHRVLADVLSALGRQEEAARASRIASRLPRYQGWGTFDPRLREAQAATQALAFVQTELSEAVRRGDMTTALRNGEALLRRRPRDPEVLGVLATIYANSGNLSRAREAIEQAVQFRPSSTELRLTRAEIAIASADFLAGQSAARHVLAVHPNDPRAHEVLGRALYLEGRTAEAFAALRRAVDLAPDSIEHRMVLHEALRSAGHTEAANLLLQESLARPATSDWARSEMATETLVGDSR